MATSFDPAKAKLLNSCEVGGIFYGLCCDHERGIIYGAGTDWAVYTVDVKSDSPKAEKKWTSHDNYVSSLVWIDGVVVSGSYDRRLIWTRAESAEQVRAVEAHDGWLRDVAVFPDGKKLASVGDDMLVKIWDAGTGELLQTCDGHARRTPEGFATALYAVAISPDGKTVASGDRIGEVCLWEADTGKLAARFQAPTFYTFDPVKRSRSIGGIRSLGFSPDGSRLAVGGIGQVTNVDGFVGPCRVELWDWQAGQRTFLGQDNHNAVLNHVAFHPVESKWLVGGGGGDGGGLIAFWDQTKEAPAHKAKPKGHLQRFCFSTDGGQLFAVGHGGFQIWALAEV